MADQRLEMLRGVPLFSACTDQQLKFIATQVEEMDFTAGRTLCKQGDRGADFFIIIFGSANVARDGAAVRKLGRGDFFGEIALIDRGVRTATVTADGPLKCLVLGPGQFQNVLHQNVDIAIAILQAVGVRLRELSGAQSD